MAGSTLAFEEAWRTGEAGRRARARARALDDLRAALQRLRKPTSSAPLPPEAIARIQRYRDAFTQLFGKKSRIRVEGRNRKGKVMLFFSEVPYEDADKVGAVLKDGILPVPGSS